MPPAYLLFRASAPSCLAFALALPAFAQWAESKSDPLLRLLSVGLRKTPRLCAHPGSIAPKLSASKNKACPFFGYHINIDLYPDPRPEAEARTDNPKCWSGYYPAGVVYRLDQISIVHIAFPAADSMRHPWLANTGPTASNASLADHASRAPVVINKGRKRSRAFWPVQHAVKCDFPLGNATVFAADNTSGKGSSAKSIQKLCFAIFTHPEVM
jgi:hypothetical protein